MGCTDKMRLDLAIPGNIADLSHGRLPALRGERVTQGVGAVCHATLE